jgi:hypothetical protein
LVLSQQCPRMKRILHILQMIEETKQELIDMDSISRSSDNFKLTIDALIEIYSQNKINTTEYIQIFEYL